MDGGGSVDATRKTPPTLLRCTSRRSYCCENWSDEAYVAQKPLSCRSPYAVVKQVPYRFAARSLSPFTFHFATPEPASTTVSPASPATVPGSCKQAPPPATWMGKGCDESTALAALVLPSFRLSDF
ncbi:hypothetical protein NDU88_003305 [Pleurodeles waltl]|uniref:Uncharacterized protein n=1 Tax=Pleurodeles waltl TaxID=8319 RepID=A0AAV7T5T5_PLEWA|nr:hypothetical protein NDU88_003305 [Pleurodeles waltl]